MIYYPPIREREHGAASLLRPGHFRGELPPDGAAAFAFLAPGTGAAAAGAAAASAILRFFFGFSAGVGGADVAIVPDAGREGGKAPDKLRNKDC